MILARAGSQLSEIPALLYDAPDRVTATERPVDRGDSSASTWIQSVHDHAVADVDSSMRAVSDEVSRLSVSKRADRATIACLRSRVMRQVHPKMTEHGHRHSTAVPARRT